MKELVEALFKSEKFHFDDVELKVMPEYKALALIGYAALKKPAAKGIEKEALEIKAKLKIACEKAGVKAIVEVNRNPCMLFGKEMGHEFSMTQKFDSLEDKEAEIRAMRKARIISAHTYPIKKDWGAGHKHACFECV